MPPIFKEENIFKTIALILSNILKDNNTTLLANIIDQSGKIILKEAELKQVLAAIYNVDCIKIEIIRSPVPANGCCLKCLEFMYNIDSIVIDGKIEDVEANNYIKSFSISTEKVYVM